MERMMPLVMAAKAGIGRRSGEDSVRSVQGGEGGLPPDEPIEWVLHEQPSKLGKRMFIYRTHAFKVKYLTLWL